MKKMSILIGIFTVFLLNCFVLSAYSKRKKIYNLNETSWELVQINRNGKNVEIPKGGKVTINFSGDKINGFSGINNYFGNYKIKNNGSSGGHNGLKNIELNIGTQNYKRFRIGISNTTYDVKDYVLGKISVKDYYDVFDILSDVLDRFYNTSFDILMSKYNRKNK